MPWGEVVMADILIRGMEMPERGEKILISADGSVWVNAWPTRGYMRMENVYSVPLPAGHGRLVDAREILEKADKAPWFDGDVSELGLLLGSEVTTIVPADGGRPVTAPTEGGTGDPSHTEGEGTDSSDSLRMTETEGG